MVELIRSLFDSDTFMPRGDCMSWSPGVVWLHAVSDGAIAVAYLIIPVALLLFVRKRQDLAFHTVFLMFGLFILLCGATHAVDVVTLWLPLYGLEGVLKGLTAVVSLATAVVVWPLIPRAVALPSMEALLRSNTELELKIADSRGIQERLERRRRELGIIIEERTAALRKINQELLREHAERRKTQKDLAEAKEAAEQAGRAKTQFLANMSHELRTPLNAIIGFSEVLEDNTFGPLNERQTRYVRNILTSGKDLLQLINDVLDLSKIEAGRMDLETDPFNARDALFDIQRVIRAAASKKSLDLGVEVPPDLPPVVADQTKFKQIMYNLLSNAVKFTPQGGSVEVRASLVTEEGADEHTRGLPMPLLKVEVADTGIGIPPDAHERIFLEFEQLDSSFQRLHEGSGLGLALTRKLVEMHGGRIWLQSEGLGKGSTFSFVLPLVPRAAASEPAGPRSPLIMVPGEEGPSEYDPNTDRSVVLVVEDDPHARELLTHYLCSGGYGVAHAHDGEEALRLARTMRPVAITLDVLLPLKDGWDVLRELKAAPETESIPVIVVSVTKDARLGFSLGAVDYLVKPVDRERLLASLRRVATCSEGGGLTVLVADDEPATVDLVGAMLRNDGHCVLSAYGGRHAVELALEHHPDAIVLDLNMPDVSGFDVIQRLRENPWTKQIPVVVFTALDLDREARARLSGDVRALLSKSAQDELLVTLHNLRRTPSQQAAKG
jgi:signal transduction histidine kinase/CheY-like chemotaxis protein